MDAIYLYPLQLELVVSGSLDFGCTTSRTSWHTFASREISLDDSCGYLHDVNIASFDAAAWILPFAARHWVIGNATLYSQ